MKKGKAHHPRKTNTNNRSIWGRIISGLAGRRFIRISMFTTLFITILVLNLATALAYYQSHNLSEIRNIDTNLDMGGYEVNASRVNATEMYQNGNQVCDNSNNCRSGTFL